MITLNRRSESAEHMPSVDVLMNDVARVFKNRAIGVIMTGMGSDGAKGMAAIFREGGLTIGQEESTCAVYGMPRACSQLGVLIRIGPLSNIPIQILGAISRRRRPA